MPENDQYNRWIDEHGNPTDVGKPSVENHDYIFYAVYGIHKYKMTWMDGDGTTALTTTAIPYGQAIEEPLAYPYKDDSALDREKTYKFIGWSLMQNGNPIKLKSYQATRDYTFYSSFTESSVYDNVISEKYLAISNDGALSAKNNIILKGKITIPEKVQGKQVTSIAASGFEAQKKITGIFFTKNCAITVFGDKAFYESYNLKYLDYPSSLEKVSANAIAECFSLKDFNLTNANKLHTIDVGAFAHSGDSYNASATPVNFKIQIPASVKVIGYEAFTNSRTVDKWYFYGEKYEGTSQTVSSKVDKVINYVTIGSVNNPSSLQSLDSMAFAGGEKIDITQPYAYVTIYYNNETGTSQSIQTLLDNMSDKDRVQSTVVEAFQH